MGDATRLRQVVANLLSNVRAHTPPGAPAAVQVTDDDETVGLAVTDSGPGLSEDQRQRVFARFYQVDSGRAHGGAGLGLAIVAAVVAAHGGEVRALPAPRGHGVSDPAANPLRRPATHNAGVMTLDDLSPTHCTATTRTQNRLPTAVVGHRTGAYCTVGWSRP